MTTQSLDHLFHSGSEQEKIKLKCWQQTTSFHDVQLDWRSLLFSWTHLTKSIFQPGHCTMLPLHTVNKACNTHISLTTHRGFLTNQTVSSHQRTITAMLQPRSDLLDCTRSNNSVSPQQKIRNELQPYRPVSASKTPISFKVRTLFPSHRTRLCCLPTDDVLGVTIAKNLCEIDAFMMNECQRVIG